ncbi:MAG: methyltransferase domain-containing protein [Pseudomonadota bacterium]
MSSTGPLVEMLQRSVRNLRTSEYLDGVESGSEVDGVRCENVERLSLADASFDLCTSTEVFEHVEDDGAGFRELYRVLRPGGKTVFTVPLNLEGPTIERAVRVDGKLIHRLPAEYHDDLLRGQNQVLAYRTYGRDIVQRLLDAGFSDARIDETQVGVYFGFGRGVVIAEK